MIKVDPFLGSITQNRKRSEKNRSVERFWFTGKLNILTTGMCNQLKSYGGFGLAKQRTDVFSIVCISQMRAIDKEHQYYI